MADKDKFDKKLPQQKNMGITPSLVGGPLPPLEQVERKLGLLLEIETRMLGLKRRGGNPALGQTLLARWPIVMQNYVFEGPKFVEDLDQLDHDLAQRVWGYDFDIAIALRLGGILDLGKVIFEDGVSQIQVKNVLKALSNYARACGGVGILANVSSEDEL